MLVKDELFKQVHAHPVLIHRHGEDLRAGQLHRAGHIRVDRLLHDHGVAGLDEERHDEVHRLIRLGQYLYFAGRRLDALGAEEGDKLLPQELIALIGAVEILAAARARHQRRDVVRDALGTEHLVGGDAAAEGVFALVGKALEKIVKGLFHVEVAILDLIDPVHAAARLVGGSRLPFPAVLRRGRDGDDVADALPGLDPCVALELAIRLDDRVAVDLKHLSQAALRGQHAAGRQRTAHDLRAKLIHDLQIDRYFALFIQLDVHAFSFRAQRLVK